MQTKRFVLPTGSLVLEAREQDHRWRFEQLVEIGARSNPKRGFLIVSKVLGRHLPASPASMRATMHGLAAKIPADAPGPILMVGMAETATALGQGIHANYVARTGRNDVLYFQSTRQTTGGAPILQRFEEGHSHASTHLIHRPRDPLVEARLPHVRTLVVVDDECSTGGTFLAVAHAMKRILPRLEGAVALVITDWSGGDWISNSPVATDFHSLLSGRLQWESSGAAPTLHQRANGHGRLPGSGTPARFGIVRPGAATLPFTERMRVTPQDRILVVGDGEYSYQALIVAEALEKRGADVALQSITRSPAQICAAMRNVINFSDSYGSGAPCFLYNATLHRPDRVLIVSENSGRQVEEMTAGLRELGYDVPVELLHCRHGAAA